MREAHTIYSYIVDRDPVRFLTVSNSAFHEYYVLYAESEFNSNRVSPPKRHAMLWTPLRVPLRKKKWNVRPCLIRCVIHGPVSRRVDDASKMQTRCNAFTTRPKTVEGSLETPRLLNILQQMHTMLREWPLDITIHAGDRMWRWKIKASKRICLN